MSKNISISEGRTAKSFTDVAKIITTQTGASGDSSTVTWVPMDEKYVTTKKITENGIYQASDEVGEDGTGYDGYSTVDVQVEGGDAGSGTMGGFYFVDTFGLSNMNVMEMTDFYFGEYSTETAE